jgi:hypothetical protein
VLPYIKGPTLSQVDRKEDLSPAGLYPVSSVKQALTDLLGGELIPLRELSKVNVKLTDDKVIITDLG